MPPAPPPRCRPRAPLARHGGATKATALPLLSGAELIDLYVGMNRTFRFNCQWLAASRVGCDSHGRRDDAGHAVDRPSEGNPWLVHTVQASGGVVGKEHRLGGSSTMSVKGCGRDYRWGPPCRSRRRSQSWHHPARLRRNSAGPDGPSWQPSKDRPAGHPKAGHGRPLPQSPAPDCDGAMLRTAPRALRSRSLSYGREPKREAENHDHPAE